MRRALLALPLLLAACTGTEAVSDYVPVADPLREPARAAPFTYGRPGALTGHPAQAAQAAAEIEAFARAAETNPLWSVGKDATLLPKLQIARREFRTALGIPASVRPEVAAEALEAAADALSRQDRGTAASALAPVGGAAVLDRLATLPRLPRVEEAAQAVAIEANRIGSGRG